MVTKQQSKAGREPKKKDTKTRLTEVKVIPKVQSPKATVTGKPKVGRKKASGEAYVRDAGRRRLIASDKISSSVRRDQK